MLKSISHVRLVLLSMDIGEKKKKFPKAATYVDSVLVLILSTDDGLHILLTMQDVPIKQKYLVTFTVGYKQKANIDAAVKKFSENFKILLFHYDGRASEWEEFEWSKRAVHVSARKQTKWLVKACFSIQKMFKDYVKKERRISSSIAGGMPKDFCIRMLLLLTYHLKLNQRLEQITLN
ncbi:hypothetical protein EJ110_NYTH03373 [Nymphaea thermarum]|nr:hypothetical protein EJ110_NYTH03373 [Nymphaea thermarum]